MSVLTARAGFRRTRSLRFCLRGPRFDIILKQMLQQSVPLDRVFQALADPARREMLERLTTGPASVSQLAAPLPMSLSAVTQHLAILEACGLVRTAKTGRVRTCTLEAGALTGAESWIRQRRTDWERRLDLLGEILAETPTKPEA